MTAQGSGLGRNLGSAHLKRVHEKHPERCLILNKCLVIMFAVIISLRAIPGNGIPCQRARVLPHLVPPGFCGTPSKGVPLTTQTSWSRHLISNKLLGIIVDSCAVVRNTTERPRFPQW